MEFAFTLLDASQPLLVCFVIIIIGKRWRRQTPLFFVSFWQLLCRRISEKVLPDNVNSQQAVISGALALSILSLPIIIILFILYYFAQYKWAFDVLILFVAADFAFVETITSQSMVALKNNKKQLAKDQLQKIVLRETKALSELGLIKANVETYALRYSYQVVTVLFYYLLFGSVFALFYRLLYETALTNNIKLTRYRRYSLVNYTIVRLLVYLPVQLLNATLLILYTIKAPKRAISVMRSKVFWALEGSSTFTTIGLIINRKIGGPIMLDGVKKRRMRVGGNSEPKIVDFYLVKHAVLFASLLFFGLVFAAKAVLQSITF
ncbi:MAG: cobalamin biosynthesis protein [Pseudomonadota bacterium]